MKEFLLTAFWGGNYIHETLYAKVEVVYKDPWTAREIKNPWVQLASAYKGDWLDSVKYINAKPRETGYTKVKSVTYQEALMILYQCEGK